MLYKYSSMKYIGIPRYSPTRIAAILILVLGASIGAWFLIVGRFADGNPLNPDYTEAQHYGYFVSAIVTPLLSIGASLLVIDNLRSTTHQNFVNNFFKLIDFHHKLVDSINDNVDYISDGDNQISKGRMFFDDLAWRIAIDYEFLNTRNSLGLTPNASDDKPLGHQITLDDQLLKHQDPTKRKLILLIYDHYFHIHQSTLSHYFRNLYYIVNFLDTHPNLSVAQKALYTSMLRAQLSNYEMLLLAYNGMHEYGTDFRIFIDRYELIKSLNNESHLPENRIKRIVDVNILGEEYPFWKCNWGKSK